MSDNYIYAEVLNSVIPTVLIPLAVVGVGLNIAATFIAALFGVKLRSEGPKRLLELLLKPKIILSAILLNVLVYGIYQGYLYYTNMSSFVFTIENNNKGIPTTVANKKYANYLGHKNSFSESDKVPANLSGIKIHWQTELPKGPFRAAAVSGDRLFFGTFDENAYEINQVNGKIERNFFLGTKVTPSPVIWNNKLVMGEGTHHTHRARIYFFDLATGKYSSSYTTKGHTEAQPVIASYNHKTLMLVVSGSDGLHAVNPDTMKAVWKQNDGHIDASVNVHNNKVYASTGREKGDAKKIKAFAVSYDFETGKKLWKSELPASGWMKPIVYKEKVCFVYGEIYFPSEVGGLQCFHQNTGEPLLGYRINQPIMARPILIGNHAYITDIKGTVCKLSLDSFDKKWCFSTNQKGKSYTTISYDQKRNLILYPSVSNGLYVINPNDGKLIYHWIPKDEQKKWSATYAAVTVTEEAWYLAHYSGLIRKISPL